MPPFLGRCVLARFAKNFEGTAKHPSCSPTPASKQILLTLISNRNTTSCVCICVTLETGFMHGHDLSGTGRRLRRAGHTVLRGARLAHSASKLGRGIGAHRGGIELDPAQAFEVVLRFLDARSFEKGRQQCDYKFSTLRDLFPCRSCLQCRWTFVADSVTTLFAVLWRTAVGRRATS
jgi:hypothetical protein